MPAILLPLLGKLFASKWTYILIAAAALAGYVGYLRWESRHLLDQRDDARQAAQQAAAVAAQQRTQHEAIVAALDKQLAQEKARSAALADIGKGLANVPKTKQCASSPGVSHVLDGLRRLESPAR